MSNKDKKELTPEQKKLLAFYQKKAKEGERVLEMARTHLYRSKCFYFNILAQFRIKKSMQVPTLGVSWVKDQMYLIYNPVYASHYTAKEFAHDLEHEVDHFVFSHVENFEDDGIQRAFKDEDEAREHVRDQMTKQVEHRLKNIAMDRSINVYIPALPGARMFRSELTGDEKDPKKLKEMMEDAVLVEKGETEELDVMEVPVITEKSFNKLLKNSGYEGDLRQIKRFERWTYYYDLLKQCPKIEEEIGKIQDTDIHFQGTPQQMEQDSEGGQGQEQQEGQGQPQQGDSNGDKESQQQAEGKESPEKNDVNRVIVEAHRRTEDITQVPGHLKSSVEQALEDMRGKPLPWYVIFRKHINKAKKTIMKPDINIRNIYYSGSQAILTAYTNEPLYRVGVIYDTSGSCSSSDIQGRFWGEVEGLRKAGAEITIYYCDADVEHVQKVNSRKKLKVEDYEGKGGGGTNLDVGILRSIKDKNNIHIMLTDNWMDFNLTKKDFKGNRVICACHTDAEMPKHYGPTIKINLEE